MSRFVMSCSYCFRYGVKAIPPWKKTSRSGHTSSRCFLPEISSTLISTESIHEGTPEMFVTFFFIVSCAILSRFTSKSDSSAVCFFGPLTRFASGLMFSMRMAERSPTSEPCTL